jgi:hypothetical protein
MLDGILKGMMPLSGGLEAEPPRTTRYPYYDIVITILSIEAPGATMGSTIVSTSIRQ